MKKINNKNMKNNSYANTSLLGKKYSKILKESSVVILAAAFLVSGFFVANVIAAGEVSVTVAPTGTKILTQNGGTEVVSFNPALGPSVIRDTDAYYGINAVSSVGFSDVHWRIRVHHDSADLNPGMVTIIEKGRFNATSNTVGDSAYTVVDDGNNLVLTGNLGWDTGADDNFTNVDLIHFDTSAPLGNYTITRELISGADIIISNPFVLSSVVATSPNNPPILDAIGNKTVNELATLTFTAVSTDVDGDIPTYSLTGAPTGAVINSSTGRIHMDTYRSPRS